MIFSLWHFAIPRIHDENQQVTECIFLESRPPSLHPSFAQTRTVRSARWCVWHIEGKNYVFFPNVRLDLALKIVALYQTIISLIYYQSLIIEYIESLLSKILTIKELLRIVKIGLGTGGISFVPLWRSLAKTGCNCFIHHFSINHIEPCHQSIC